MKSLCNMWAVGKRELGAYFASPVAYIFVIIFLLLSGFMTFMVGQFFARNSATLDAFFIWHPWLYLFLAPALGMRLWAEERRVGTLELLMTLPITAWQAIVGKFLAALSVLALALVLTFPIIITVAFLGTPDYGAIATGYLGSLAVAATYLAISCMTSAMTRNQVISFVLALVICLFNLLAGWPPVTGMVENWAPQWLVSGIAAFSAMPYLETMQKGVIDLRAAAYFITAPVFFLFTTAVILHGRRTR